MLSLKNKKEFKNGICNTIGRFSIEINTKIWILDVVFPKLAKEFNEYLISGNGMYRRWIYDLNDASMREFTMSVIEQIPQIDRTPINIIRKIISEMSSLSNISFNSFIW